MDNNYINEKISAILIYLNIDTSPDRIKEKKFLKLILESVWLAGKVEGVQSVREMLK